jgi:hypothetical protein
MGSWLRLRLRLRLRAVYRRSLYITHYIIVGAARAAAAGSGGGGGWRAPNPGETGLALGPSVPPRSSVDSSATVAAVDGMLGCECVAPGVCGGMFDKEFDPPTFPMNQLGSQPRSPFASLTA